ncbi:MAG: phosphatase PAP2 family protein [Polyangiaceae bacterium]
MTSAPSKLWAHMRSLWPRYTLAPVAPFVGWWLYSLARGERRWEVAAAAIVPVVLSYTSARTKQFFINTLPIFLVGLFYDAMGLVQQVGLSEDRIHVCDLHDFDARWFGPTINGITMAWPDWFRAHQSLWLDVYCAIPYGTFIYVAIAYAIYLYRTDAGALNRFAWAFMLLNFTGFATYHLFPAAPPWYFHTLTAVQSILLPMQVKALHLRVSTLCCTSNIFEGFTGDLTMCLERSPRFMWRTRC